MFTAQLSVADPNGLVAKVFSSEMQKRDRSVVSMKKGKDLIFTVTAKDFTAYKASLLSLIKLLEVHFKVEALYESDH